MAHVSLGNHSKIVARHADQQQIRAFYRDVLGCVFTKESKYVDYIRFHEGFFLAVLYRDSAVSAEEAENAIWLELRSDDPAATRKRILDFGVRELDVPDAEHLYFQSPGGQVFRLVRNGEDLSRFEQ